MANPTPEIRTVPPPRLAPEQPLHQPERMAPRRLTLGGLQVEEDLNQDRLSPTERAIYTRGMDRLKKAVGHSNNSMEKMVLTNPDVSSVIIGTQPLVSMDTGEAVVTYQAFKRAGDDLNGDYAFFDFGIGIENGTLVGNAKGINKMLMNAPAAENVLRQYQSELGITIPADQRLNKEAIVNQVKALVNGSDLRKAHLAMGLLSGFPFEDCQWALSNGFETNPISKLDLIEDASTRFTGGEGYNLPESILNADYYSLKSNKNQYFPDSTQNAPPNSDKIGIEALGIRWMATNPPLETTIAKCQQLLQIDREIGLTKFVDEQRTTFDTEGLIESIRTFQKKMDRHILSKRNPTARDVLTLFADAYNKVTNIRRKDKKAA